MQKGQSHPASAVSEEMLSRGLMDLLEIRSYQDITVTALCEYSQIARRTFYRHFATIEDVLFCAVSEMIKEFIREMNAKEKAAYKEIVIAYFLFWEKYAGFLRNLERDHLTHVVFTEYIKCLYEVPWVFLPANNLSTVTDVFNCKLAFGSGGLWSLLTYWIAGGCRQSGERLAEILCDIP